MKVKDFLLSTQEELNESLPGIVYYYSDIPNALKIIISDTMPCISSLGVDSDFENGNKFFFKSFSTIKFGGYSLSKFYKDNPAVTFVLNGDKLNQNYKAAPFDYWGREYRNAAISSKDKSIREKNFQYDENEVRILTNEPKIKNISKYIKEIHLYDPSTTDWQVYNLYKECEKKKINVYMYKDENAFKLLDTRRTIMSIAHPGEKKSREEYSKGSDIQGIDEIKTVLAATKFNEVPWHVSGLEVQENQSFNDWLIYQKKYNHYISDIKHSLDYSKFEPENLKDMTDLLKKTKSKNLYELLYKVGLKIAELKKRT